MIPTCFSFTLVLGAPTPNLPAAQLPNPTLPFAPVNQSIPGPSLPLAPWPNAAVSSGIPTASASVSTIRGMQPYPMIRPPPGPQVMFPRPPQPMSSRPPQPMSPTGGMSWSANVVNRMKPDEPKVRGPSPLDLLGQEALTAHKESQNKPKVENQPPEKKDAMLLDIGDSITPQPTPSIPPPPAAVPPSDGSQATDTPLDHITLPMDKIKPGESATSTSCLSSQRVHNSMV